MDACITTTPKKKKHIHTFLFPIQLEDEPHLRKMSEREACECVIVSCVWFADEKV